MRTIAALALVIAGCIPAIAQVDTTRNVFRPEKKGVNSSAINVAEPAPRPGKYLLQNRLVIRPDHLPNGLRETLVNEVYRGWENNTIYQDRETGDFYYEVPASDTIPRRTFRFDRDGKPIGIDRDQE